MTTRRTLALAGLLALAGFVGFGADAARAQMGNTYEDVPFNQGSLFYRPSGRRPPRATSTPRRPAAAARVAPQVVPFYVAQAGYVAVPQGGQVVYYYVPQPGYYYFPAR